MRALFQRFFPFLLLCLLLASCRAAPGASQARTGTPQQASIVHDEVKRTFIYYAPANLPTEPVPLVFMLHGGGGSAEHTMTTMTEGRWNALGEQFAIDPARVYGAGHSNGGMMAFRLAIELGDRIAAAFSSAGNLARTSECAPPNRAVPILYLAGTANPMMPFEGGPIAIPDSSDRGEVLSAAETVQFWVEALHVPADPEESALPDVVPSDGSTVTLFRYGGDAGRAAFLFYRVEGGGHGWPSPTPFGRWQQARKGQKNQDINACDEAWRFFQAHSLALP
ncbi:MAG: hypothetical protein H0T73_08145 [Ardenticatenales bacterium]|nr:hypothetical protein [Ardenticatenales bacterium]